MKTLQKLLTNYRLTWPKLIIFSIICAIYTATMLLLDITKNTAFREIGIGYEMWFILAIFVVSNSKNTIDAGLKTFIFFLISQPLIFIIEDIILHENFLKSYYFPWFIQTLFTLPGGMIAYQIKRNNLLSVIILAVAGSFLCFVGMDFIIRSTYQLGISHLIYGILLIIFAIVLGFIFFDKKLRIIYIIIILFVSIFVTSFSQIINGYGGIYEMDMDSNKYQIIEENSQNMNITFQDNILQIKYKAKSAKATIIFESTDNQTLTMEIIVNNGQVTINESITSN